MKGQPDRDEPRRWRTQIHTIPTQVGPAIECYGLGIYPGPIAYLALAVGDQALDVGLLPGQVDALLNALKDARLCFEENGVPPVEVVESREPFPSDEDALQVATAGVIEATGGALTQDEAEFYARAVLDAVSFHRDDEARDG